MEMSNKQLRGIFPAVLTPFARNGSVDLDRFARHVDRLYSAGVNGIFVGGNAGEWHSMTIEEREELAHTAVNLSHGRGKTIVHIGCVRLRDSMRLARHADEVGADAVGSLMPCMKSRTIGEIKTYFARLASESNLPFIVYYFPAMTGGISGERLFSALRDLPNLAGYKFTDSSLLDLGLLLDDGITVFNGHDPNLKSALLMGAAGGIGSFYNIMPRHAVEIYRACRSSDLAHAEQMQREMNRVIRAVRKHRLVPALKFLSQAPGLDLGEMREPMLPLTAEEKEEIRNELSWLWARNESLRAPSACGDGFPIE